MAARSSSLRTGKDPAPGPAHAAAIVPVPVPVPVPAPAAGPTPATTRGRGPAPSPGTGTRLATAARARAAPGLATDPGPDPGHKMNKQDPGTTTLNHTTQHSRLRIPTAHIPYFQINYTSFDLQPYCFCIKTLCPRRKYCFFMVIMIHSMFKQLVVIS